VTRLLERRAQKTAICFDLDGTVTRQEILPRLAIEAGLEEEIATLTSATIRGLIPFESSFKLRTRLLQDIPLEVVGAVIRRIPLHARIREFIRKHAERCFIVTGNLDVWVQPLVEELGCGFFSSVAAVRDGRLTGIAKILNKADAVQALRAQFDRVIAVGDGMNDAPMFEAADIGISFGGVHEPVETLIHLSDYVVYHEAGLCSLLDTLS